MTINAQAAAYLRAFFRGEEFEDGLAYRDELRALDLDFSLDSLVRMDALLDRLRATHGGTEAAFIRENANQDFLYLLAFYLGETVRRATDARADWYDYAGMVALSPGFAAVGNVFGASATCVYNGTPEGPDFFPLTTITTRLFDGDSKSARAVADWCVERIGRLELPPIDPVACLTSLLPADRSYPYIPAPEWMAKDALKATFARHRDLWLGGRVVWGRIVQANTALFAPGDEDLPGDVVYDPTGAVPHTDLIAPGRALLALKGTRPADAALAEIADALDAGWVRFAGKAVPASVSPHRLQLSSVLFHRPHLPGGKVSLMYFPLLVNDRHPGAVMVLPGRFWPGPLERRWEFQAQ
jgi:hypothetical protein